MCFSLSFFQSLSLSLSPRPAVWFPHVYIPYSTPAFILLYLSSSCTVCAHCWLRPLRLMMICQFCGRLFAWRLHQVFFFLKNRSTVSSNKGNNTVEERKQKESGPNRWNRGSAITCSTNYILIHRLDYINQDLLKIGRHAFSLSLLGQRLVSNSVCASVRNSEYLERNAEYRMLISSYFTSGEAKGSLVWEMGRGGPGVGVDLIKKDWQSSWL